MPIIEVDRLQKRYGDTVAVADVSFSIEEGEIFGILGPNGAGKTTTVEAIAGLREPDAGSIRVMGLDPFDRREELRRVLGIQLQESQQPDKLEVGEALDLYASFYQSAADPDALLAALGLAGKPQPVREALGRPEAAAVDRAGADRKPADRGARRAHDGP